MLALSVLTGFLTTLLLIPLSKDFLRSSGIVGIDQQKKDRPVIPTSGGVPVLFGFLVGISLFLGLKTFLSSGINISFVLAALSSVLVIGLIGLIDDIHVKKQEEQVKKESQLSVGFEKWWIKPLFVIPAALPLMVVRAGQSSMVLPFIGTVDFGILYPLLLVPLGVICVSNGTNMLAGQNGLEAGIGALALFSIGVFALINGGLEAAALSLIMSASLIAFLFYNFYPAEILPGDSLTYSIGAVIAASAIIGNVQRFAMVVFTPWIFEAFLKLRSRFEASSLGELEEDNSLTPKHDKLYSLTHIIMRSGKVTEKRLVQIMYFVELFFVGLAFVLFL